MGTNRCWLLIMLGAYYFLHVWFFGGVIKLIVMLETTDEFSTPPDDARFQLRYGLNPYNDNGTGPPVPSTSEKPTSTLGTSYTDAPIPTPTTEGWDPARLERYLMGVRVSLFMLLVFFIISALFGLFAVLAEYTGSPKWHRPFRAWLIVLLLAQILIAIFVQMETHMVVALAFSMGTTLFTFYLVYRRINEMDEDE